MSSRALKYIRLAGAESWEPDGIVVFPCYLAHADVANGRTVVSAGWVDLSARRCYGRSESLGLAARPGEDSRLLRVAFGPAERK